MEAYKAPAAIILLLMRRNNGKEQVLLQRRNNTGFADGMWDFSCAGKVEDGETMRQTALREAKEELKVEIFPENLQFAALVHKRDRAANLIYYNAYFICRKFCNEPTIGEPEKCSQLRWFDADSLPDDLIADRKRAFNAYLNGERYIEYGW